MFFEPDSFLERDPADAETPQEATRLEREAGQRARLCEAMVAVAAQRGYEEARAHRVFGAAAIGSGTFHKLFASKEACFQAAFEACARLISRRIQAGLEGVEGTRPRTEAGLRALVEVLDEEPDLARVVVVEARAGGMASREAQLQWLNRLAGLFAGEGVDAESAEVVLPNPSPRRGMRRRRGSSRSHRMRYAVLHAGRHPSGDA